MAIKRPILMGIVHNNTSKAFPNIRFPLYISIDRISSNKSQGHRNEKLNYCEKDFYFICTATRIYYSFGRFVCKSYKRISCNFKTSKPTDVKPGYKYLAKSSKHRGFSAGRYFLNSSEIRIEKR